MGMSTPHRKSPPAHASCRRRRLAEAGSTLHRADARGSPAQRRARCAARDRRPGRGLSRRASATGKRTGAASIFSLCRTRPLSPHLSVYNVPVHAGDIDPQSLHRRRAVGGTAAAGVLADGGRRRARAARARARAAVAAARETHVRRAHRLLLLSPRRRHPPPGLGHRPRARARAGAAQRLARGRGQRCADAGRSATAPGSPGRARHEPAQPARAGAGPGRGEARGCITGGCSASPRWRSCRCRSGSWCRCWRCPRSTTRRWARGCARAGRALLLMLLVLAASLALAARRARGGGGLRARCGPEAPCCWCCVDLRARAARRGAAVFAVLRVALGGAP